MIELKSNSTEEFDKIDDREVYMEGIDASYNYKGIVHIK